MLLFCDGFDHYGTGGSGATIAEAGAWAELSNASPSAANPRTGLCAMRLGGASEARRSLPRACDNVGQGGAYYFSNLPSANDRSRIMRFSDGSNEDQLHLAVEATGRIGVYQGLTKIHESTAQAYARAYFHLEAYLVVDGATGALEVRLNGVTIINLAGINTDPAGSGEVSIIGIDQGSFGATIDLDDYYAWSATDDTGDVWNTDFIGDKKVYTVVPDADTATEEWSRASGADSFAMIDAIPPDDGAQYLYADDVLTGGGPKTVVEMGEIPVEVVSIAGVTIATRIWKTDAGNAKVRPSIISGGDEALGEEHAVSMAPTYYHDSFDVDPDTSAPWTVPAINAVQTAIDRTD